MDLLRFITAGSVDDGKSTLIGRLLCDCAAVYDDQLASVAKASRGGLDFAFITDGLRAEREQGITIDVAYRYFSTSRRRFIIADTPGHEQYTRNMATGASTAQLALLLLDARRGVLVQTRRHLYLAWLMGIRTMLVAINKMDLVGYRREIFESIAQDVQKIVERLDGCDCRCIPVSALAGENVVRRSERTPWFTGMSVLQHLESVPLAEATAPAALRLPVQYVIRCQPDFRGYAGQIVSGSVAPGDPVMVLPSRQVTRVHSLPAFDGEQEHAAAGVSVAVRLDDELDISRGDMIVSLEDQPVISRQWRAALVWMDETPLASARPYLLKHTTQRICAQVSRIVSRVDLGTLEPSPADGLALNEIGTVDIETHKDIFCDPYSVNRGTGSFILIDPIRNHTVAAGMILEPLRESAGNGTPARIATSAPNGKQSRGMTVWFTGLSSAGKTTLSRAVYERLWAMGCKVELLDGDEVRRHLCKDLGFSRHDRDENIRRIGFVAELLTRNGVIALVSAISPYRTTRDELRAKIGEFVEVYVNASLQVCEQRDVKGLYAKARSGQIPAFTGIDDPYEPPLTPEVECRTDRETLAESLQKVLDCVETKFLSET
ncbi:MAG: adenylyl-sulfate kinase [Terriglobales bacterium]|jgi:bifunctional enzyme CysN/CysC